MQITNNIKNFFNSVANENNSQPISKSFEEMASSIKSMPSVLSKNFNVEGDIKCAGILEIEGKIKGTVNGQCVIIRENGSIEGKVNVESITIRGNFTGDMVAKSISITKKAKVIGNIEYNSLSVEDGACVDGQFKRVNFSEKTDSKSYLKVAETATDNNQSKKG